MTTFGNNKVATGGYLDSTSAMRDALTGISNNITEQQKMKASQEQLALANARADAQLSLQQAANQRIVDDRAATSNALTTQAKLGAPGHGNVGLDYAQGRSQQSLSDNVSDLFAPTDKVFKEGFQSVLGKVGIDESTLQQAMAAGDTKAVDLYKLAKSEGDKRADSLATQIGLPTDLNETLMSNNDVTAMSTPTLEQEYIARKNAATASGNAAAIKAVDDAMLPTVQAEREASALTAKNFKEQKQSDYKDQVALLQKATEGGKQAYDKSGFGNISSVPADAQDYVTSDFNWDREGRADKTANALALLGVNSKDILPILKSINPSEKSFLGYKFDDISFEALKEKYGTKIADTVKGYTEGTKTADDLLKLKKKSSTNGMSYDAALEELEKLRNARDAFNSASTDRLSASTNRLDTIFSGLKPTKSAIEEAIGAATPKIGTANSTVDPSIDAAYITTPYRSASDIDMEGFTTYLKNNEHDPKNNGKDIYKVKNPSTNALGPYQILESTSKDYIEGGINGIPGITAANWKDPKNQDKIYSKIVEVNAKSLEKDGIALTPANLYGAHQQGLSGFKEIYKYVDDLSERKTPKPLPAERIVNMRNNMQGKDKGLTDAEVPGAWMAMWAMNVPHKTPISGVTQKDIESAISHETLASTQKEMDAKFVAMQEQAKLEKKDNNSLTKYENNLLTKYEDSVVKGKRYPGTAGEEAEATTLYEINNPSRLQSYWRDITEPGFFANRIKEIEKNDGATSAVATILLDNGVTTALSSIGSVAGAIKFLVSRGISKKLAQETAKNFYKKQGGKSTTPPNSRVLQEQISPTKAKDFYKNFGG